MLRFDTVHVDLSRAVTTPEGWIRDKPILTRAGVFAYRNANGTIRRELRPAEWVFEDSHLASLHGAPITVDHPAGGKMASADDAPVTIGAGIGPGERQDHEMPGPLVIHNPKAMGTRRELSLGYNITRLDETPGQTEAGEPYDAIQVGPYRINHIAVVPKGRAGTSRLRLDAADAFLDTPEHHEDPSMPDQPVVTVRLDGLNYSAAPEVANALTNAQTRADAAEGERDAQRARADAAETVVVQVKADADARVAAAALEAANATRQRLTLEAAAKAHEVPVVATATDRDVKVAVITKLTPSAAADIATRADDDGYINARFDIALADADTRKQAGAAQVQTATPTASTTTATPIRSAQAGRDLMIRAKRA